MCRLLGIYGQTDIWQDIAMAFSRQAETGHIPPGEDQKPGHKDGWGITISNQNNAAMMPVIRQLGSASNSSSFQEVIRTQTQPPTIFICHLRKASDIIPINLSNAHPFFHNGWAFIHNGTVFNARSLPRDPGFVSCSDESDTEYLFHYLLSKIGDRPAGQSIAGAIVEAAASIPTDYSALNCLLSNGRELFAIRQYKQWEDYYTLYAYEMPGSLIISSQPVNMPQLNPDNWKLLSNNLLLKIYGNPLKSEHLPIPCSS